MSLLNQIKKDQLTARKERNTARAGTLTVLLAEATAVGKNDGNRETTDGEVIKVIKKTIKNLNELLDAATSTQHAVAQAKAMFEINMLESYLPTQMDEAALTTLIRDIIDAHELTNMKGMGTVMKELKAHCEGEYDGKMASDIVKKLLS